MKTLTEFPERGVCWQSTKELVQYLQNRPNAVSSSSMYSLKRKGVAWNNTSCWAVQTSSNQPEYTIEQLTPFISTTLTPIVGEWYYYMGAEAGGLDSGKGWWEKGVLAKFKCMRGDTSWEVSETSSPNMNNCGASNKARAFRKATFEEVQNYLRELKPEIPELLAQYPVTSEESFTPPDDIKQGSRVVYYEPGNILHGIEGIVGRIYYDKDSKFIRVELQRPLPRHPEGGDLLSFPLKKARLVREPVPEKWAIRITEENKQVLTNFLIRHKNEYKGYMDSWKPCPGYYFLYPQPEKKLYACCDLLGKYSSYTEVTFDQIKHVLTNTLTTEKKIEQTLKIKQDAKENNKPSTGACKIYRLDFSIRAGAPIRTVTIRCNNSKVKLRS